MATAALAGSCAPSGGTSIEITIHAPPPAAAQGGCPDDAPPTPVAGGPTTLRLTYRRTAGALLCDTIVDLGAPRRLIGVPKGASALTAVDIVVETFVDDGGALALAGSGVARAVDLAHASTAEVLVAPVDEFACTPRPAAQGRAFHTATTLPDGRVLLVGGLVPDAANAAVTQVNLDSPTFVGGFYASASVEIYDPQSGTFATVDAPGLTARAFHAAYVLPGDDEARVLLVGGLAPGAGGGAPVADGVRNMVEPLRLVPSASAVAAPAEVLTLAADGTATVTSIDAGAGFAPRLLAATTRAPSVGDDLTVVGASAAPIVAGGYRDYPTPFDDSFEAVDLAAPAARGAGVWPLEPPERVGATVTWISNSRAVVWGGNLGSALGSESTDIGNLLTDVASGSPGSAPVTFVTTGLTPAARAFHAAVAVGEGDLLVVGGFRLAAGAAIDPALPFAERVRFTAGSAEAAVEALTLSDGGNAAVPVGYLDATPLAAGEALVTGGSPAQAVGDSRCPDGTADFGLCAVDDAWRWDPATGALVRTDPLLVRRWGHRTAVLADGTVLVTGGFTNAGQTLAVVRTAELYNPRTTARDAAADALGPDVTPRLPGDVARDAQGAPLAPCEVVALEPSEGP